MKGIAIDASSSLTLVDHLVPLCALMDIPLLCTDPGVAATLSLYYPFENIISDPGEGYTLDTALESYDTFFYVEHARLGNGAFQFYDHTCQKQAKAVSGLHGNGDKKRNAFWIERYADDDVVLYYGPHMRDFLTEKGVWSRIPKKVQTGNFRLEYYRENKTFFDAFCAHIPRDEKKNILYAPSWCHPQKDYPWREDFSSFFEVYPFIFDACPQEYRLIVKLHPLYERFFSAEIEKIKERYPHILFIDHFSLIYPLLNKIDLYLGDYSSIGYDALAFDLPLVFLLDGKRNPATDKGLTLMSAGTSLFPQEYPKLYQHLDQLKKKETFSLYHYAFGDQKPLTEVRQEIVEALS